MLWSAKEANKKVAREATILQIVRYRNEGVIYKNSPHFCVSEDQSSQTQPNQFNNMSVTSVQPNTESLSRHGWVKISYSILFSRRQGEKYKRV